jgi:hypothetical protein
MMTGTIFDIFGIRNGFETWNDESRHSLGAVLAGGPSGPAPQRGRAHPQVRPRGRGARRRPRTPPRVTGNERGAGAVGGRCDPARPRRPDIAIEIFLMVSADYKP